MELDDTICYCFHISKRKILNYIRVHRPRRASQVSECGGAGTGCGWCVPFLKRYFNEATAGAVSSSGPFETEGPVVEDLNPEEYARRRAGYIREGGRKPPPGAIPLPEA